MSDATLQIPTPSRTFQFEDRDFCVKTLPKALNLATYLYGFSIAIHGGNGFLSMASFSLKTVRDMFHAVLEPKKLSMRTIKSWLTCSGALLSVICICRNLPALGVRNVIWNIESLIQVQFSRFLLHATL